MLFKVFLHLKDGQIATVTFTTEQAVYFYAVAAFYGYKAGSVELGQLVFDLAKEGQVKSINVSRKTREQLVEEMKRNYGENIVEIRPKEEDNGQ